MKTPTQFVQEYNGKVIDYDGAYGVQQTVRGWV